MEQKAKMREVGDHPYHPLPCPLMTPSMDPQSKESACNSGVTGDVGSIPGLGRSPGGGHGNSLQYSCLENSMDRIAWWAIQFKGLQRVGHN